MTETRKPFAAFVQEQRNGGLHGELSEALADLVTRCDEHRKSGSLTLTISIAPNADGVTFTVTDTVKVKAPEPARAAALFFADEAGNLMRRDPRQIELPLRDVSPPAEADPGEEAVSQ